MKQLLLNLPGELLNRIYELVVAHDAKVEKTSHRTEAERCKVDRIHEMMRSTASELPHRTIRLVEEEMNYKPSFYARLAVLLSERKGSLTLHADYDKFRPLPASYFEDAQNIGSVQNLHLSVSSRAFNNDSHVDLLPILRAKADHDIDFECQVEKNGHFHDDAFRSYLLLKRILGHENGDWLVLFSEPVSVDAVLFKISTREINVVLKHDMVPGRRWTGYLQIGRVFQSYSKGDEVARSQGRK
ncbi:hypothetical protein BU23DRAFT_568405 [Bimuria novae-zelandiae CBS 107.79]|uniref:Uncharacterized protein n=1 Tax=Bimuria novae-zelandiae CBS 107.79 TaxID=1447943 RepID=A0A6A5V981_9PLEO|nr:hypothetical protein BU23DRAFT_568405 [Bimuria novae-zelandiae CBS 107.79]